MKRVTRLSEASTFLHECVCLRTRHILVDGQSKGLPRWLMVKKPPASVGAAGNEGSILGREDLLEKEMATYSSILAWRIPRTWRIPEGDSPWGCKE